MTNEEIAHDLVYEWLNRDWSRDLAAKAIKKALERRVEECAKIVIDLHENGETYDMDGLAVAAIRKLNEETTS